MTWFELAKAAVDSPPLVILVLALRIALPLASEVARSIAAWLVWWQLGWTGHSPDFRRTAFRARLGVADATEPPEPPAEEREASSRTAMQKPAD